jgi:serine/threonine-protein kinase
MSTTMETSPVRRRSRSRIAGLLGATALVGSTVIGATGLLGPSAGAQPGGTCVEATNTEHAEAERAYEFLIFAFARGSFDFLGLSWSTTSLQEGPAGTWTEVESCDGPGTTTTTMPGTTTTTGPGTTTTMPSTTTTMPSTTTTMPSTTTTVPGTTTTTHGEHDH